MPFTCAKVDQRYREMKEALSQLSVRLQEKIEFADVAEVRKMEQKLEREKDELVLEMVYGHWKRYKNGEVVAAYGRMNRHVPWCPHQDGIVVADEDSRTNIPVLLIRSGSLEINRIELPSEIIDMQPHPNGMVVHDNVDDFTLYTKSQEKIVLCNYQLAPLECWYANVDGVLVEKENKIYRNLTTEVFAGPVDEGWVGYKNGFAVERRKNMLLNGKKVVFKISETIDANLSEIKPHPRGFVLEMHTDSGMKLLLNGKTVLYDGPKFPWDSHPDGVIVLKVPTWVFYNESQEDK